MKEILVAASAAILTSPLPASACDGSISCAMRSAPRQMLRMLPGFLTTHAGLLIGIVLGAVVVSVVFRREAEVVRKD